LGVRIFDKPEHPKTGASLALPRREARSARRRLRRHRFRIQQIKMLFDTFGIMKISDIQNMYNSSEKQPNVYKLRYEALERCLTKEETVRVLIHIAQRRGFKSNRKADTQDKKSESGRMLDAVEQNNQLMLLKGYRTVGEMLFKDDKYSVTKKNKADDYSHTVSFQAVLDEINQIFDSQKKLFNPIITNNLIEKYIKIFSSRRSFDEGPGKGSPYAGNQIEKMLGKCTFEANEKRAVKASYTFERFMLFNKLNNLRIYKIGGGYRKLSDGERTLIVNTAYNSPEVTFSRIRKLLNLEKEETFKGLTYGKKSIDDVDVILHSKWQNKQPWFLLNQAD
jgi:CRISPR-associated endonuclease Csn1